MDALLTAVKLECAAKAAGCRVKALRQECAAIGATSHGNPGRKPERPRPDGFFRGARGTARRFRALFPIIFPVTALAVFTVHIHKKGKGLCYALL